MRRVCVFCGSNAGGDPGYASAAQDLGRLLATRGLGLVYGGGSVGLMGVVADAALDAGGEVIGVIPERLATKELLHTRVPDMRRVRDMHERKALMAELADAFIALPGGYGTLEELFEVITWAQLGFHRKNIGLLNFAGYFDRLVSFVDHAVSEAFIRPDHRELILVEKESGVLLDRLATHQMPEVRKWLGPEEI
ncbi:MAG: TIGR00730 family Rossman fold protein [Planctomycetaceae bacterium]